MPVILPATEVRERFSAILEQVTAANEPVFITKHGRAQAVLLSAAQYETLSKEHSQVTPTDTEWYVLA